MRRAALLQKLNGIKWLTGKPQGLPAAYMFKKHLSPRGEAGSHCQYVGSAGITAPVTLLQVALATLEEVAPAALLAAAPVALLASCERSH